jgi:hypothetical protein
VILVDFYVNFPGWGTLKTKVGPFFEEKGQGAPDSPKHGAAPARHMYTEIILTRSEKGLTL